MLNIKKVHIVLNSILKVSYILYIYYKHSHFHLMAVVYTPEYQNPVILMKTINYSFLMKAGSIALDERCGQRFTHGGHERHGNVWLPLNCLQPGMIVQHL